MLCSPRLITAYRDDLVQSRILGPSSNDLGLVNGYHFDHVCGLFPCGVELLDANSGRLVSREI